MQELVSSPTPAADPILQLSKALAALRCGSNIPVERARAIVACAFTAIDVLQIEHTNTRNRHDSQQEQDQEH